MSHPSRRGIGSIVACTLLWGTISPVVRSIDAPARVIVAFRLAIGAIVVIVTAIVSGRRSDLRLRGNRSLVIVSGLTLAVHWAMLFESYKRLEVVASVGIVFAGPVIAAVAAPVVLGERLRVRALTALAIGAGGLALITLPDAGSLDPVGVACAFGAAVTFAALILIGKLLTRQMSPLGITAWQLGVAAIPMSVGLAGGLDGVADAWPFLLLLGVVHTGVAGLLFFRALGTLDAQTVGTLFYLEPASAVVYARIFLGERPPSRVLVGFALVVVAGVGIIFERLAPPSSLEEPSIPGA